MPVERAERSQLARGYNRRDEGEEERRKWRKAYGDFLELGLGVEEIRYERS